MITIDGIHFWKLYYVTDRFEVNTMMIRLSRLCAVCYMLYVPIDKIESVFGVSEMFQYFSSASPDAMRHHCAAAEMLSI